MSLWHYDLCAGIGGFSIAADSVWGSDIKGRTMVENSAFALAVLHKHWPDAEYVLSVCDNPVVAKRDTGAALLTAGLPCQPYSETGRKLGGADERNIWSAVFAWVRTIHPEWCVFENVPGLLVDAVLPGILHDLENEGYCVQMYCVPACAVGAVHKRSRVWVIAHTAGIQLEEWESEPWKNQGRGKPVAGEGVLQNWPCAATRLCGVDDGVPAGVDQLGLTRAGYRKSRLIALGNAVVPEAAAVVLRAVKAVWKFST